MVCRSTKQVFCEVRAVPITRPLLHLMGVEFLSHQATTWVLERSEHEGIEFVVLFVIANHCHPDGSGAFPSIHTIAAQSRVSERTARYCVKSLESSGELTVKRSLGGVANQEWKSRNDYTIPGVVRDGFFTERKPKTENSQRHQLPLETIPSGKASGNPSGNELPPNNPLELNIELEPEQQKILNEKECSQCGGLGVHKCPGRVSSRQRFKRSQGKASFQRRPFDTELPPKYVSSYPKAEPEAIELSSDFPRLKPPQ